MRVNNAPASVGANQQRRANMKQLKMELNQEQKMLTQVIKLYFEAQHLASKVEDPKHRSFYQIKRSAHLDAITALERVCSLTDDQHQMCWHAAEMEVFGCIR
jgi:hypothetical protein